MPEIQQGSCAKITTPNGKVQKVSASQEGGYETTVVQDGLVGKVIGKTTKGMYYFMVFHNDKEQWFPAAKVLASWCTYARTGCAAFSGKRIRSDWKRWE